MKRVIDSFIVGMSAGAIFTAGNGLAFAMVGALIFGALNGFLAWKLNRKFNR